jgi:hypothetical protein
MVNTPSDENQSEEGHPTEAMIVRNAIAKISND